LNDESLSPKRESEYKSSADEQYFAGELDSAIHDIKGLRNAALRRRSQTNCGDGNLRQTSSPHHGRAAGGHRRLPDVLRVRVNLLQPEVRAGDPPFRVALRTSRGDAAVRHSRADVETG
jgi:hypothetical protein